MARRDRLGARSLASVFEAKQDPPLGLRRSSRACSPEQMQCRVREVARRHPAGTHMGEGRTVCLEPPGLGPGLR